MAADHLIIAPVLVASLLAGEERLPVYTHLIDHPDGRILVDTGMTRLHPAVADMDPRLNPLDEQHIDLASITAVINTHLHFDHCGGNHLFPDRPIYVQRQEIEDARTQDDYTIREWVDAPGSVTCRSRVNVNWCRACDCCPLPATPAVHRSSLSERINIRP